MLYTNADQLVNKRDELSMLIAGNEPHVILISEVIPKAQSLPLSLALLCLPEYNLYLNFDPGLTNLGRSQRGVCIYVKDNLFVSEVSLHESSVVEHLWISLKLLNGDKLLIGCIYLSPSRNRHQSMMELDEILKAACNLKASHVLIAGDFNTPQINWSDIHSDEPCGHYSHSLVN